MNGKRKGGELRQIKVKEMSVVDAGANRRKWLFFKGDLSKAKVSFSGESDGSLEGTKITVNEREIEDLKSFYFSFYNPSEDEELFIAPVSMSYTVEGESKPGFQTTQSYELAKAEGELKMDYVKLGAFVKALTGKDVTEEQFKKMDESTLEQLNVLSQYQGQMPTDLSKAVGHFLKVEEPPETPTETPAETPAGSGDLTPETLASLQSAFDRLSALVFGKKDDDPVEASKDLLAKLKGFADRIGKLEKGEKPDPEKPVDETETDSAKILKVVQNIDERLKVVEKSSGVEKGITDGGGGGREEPEVDHYKSIDL